MDPEMSTAVRVYALIADVYYVLVVEDTTLHRGECPIHKTEHGLSPGIA